MIHGNWKNELLLPEQVLVAENWVTVTLIYKLRGEYFQIFRQSGNYARNTLPPCISYYVSQRNTLNLAISFPCNYHQLFDIWSDVLQFCLCAMPGCFWIATGELVSKPTNCNIFRLIAVQGSWQMNVDKSIKKELDAEAHIPTWQWVDTFKKEVNDFQRKYTIE